MTTSPNTDFLSEIAKDEVIPEGKLTYFRARTRSRIYDFILRKWMAKAEAGHTQADLARRIRRSPEVVNRWLGSPGNWTIDTISDLLVGIGAEELEPSSISLLGRPPRNDTQPYWVQTRPNIEAKFRPEPTSPTPTNGYTYSVNS